MLYSFIGGPWDGELHETRGFAQMYVQQRQPIRMSGRWPDIDPLLPVSPEATITYDTWVYDLLKCHDYPTYYYKCRGKL